MRAAAPDIGNATSPLNSRRALTLLLCALPFLMAIHALSQADRDFQVGMDFRMTFTVARAWAQGVDPYDDAALKAVWAGGGMPQATPPGLPQTPNVYPLSIGPLLAPLVWLPYPDALALWLILNSIAAAIIVWQVMGPTSTEPGRLRPPSSTGIDRQFHGPDRRSLCPAFLSCVAACILLLGFPLRYGLTFGNMAVLTTFLVMQTLIHRDRPGVAGLCFGIALVKHSLCAPLALLFLFEKRWRLLGVATAVQLGLLGTATVGYGDATGLAWIPRMLDAGFASMTPGAINHFAALEYSALHLEMASLLHRLAPALGQWRHAVVAALGILVVASFLLPGDAQTKTRCDRSQQARTELRYIVLLAFTLLAIYHRVYDLILVIGPLLWWLVRYNDVVSRHGRTALWLAAALSMYAGASVAGGRAAVPWPVLAFVQPSAIWALLLLLFAACYELFRLHRGVAASPSAGVTSVPCA